jgi:hypothetical protein
VAVLQCHEGGASAGRVGELGHGLHAVTAAGDQRVKGVDEHAAALALLLHVFVVDLPLLEHGVVKNTAKPSARHRVCRRA